AEVLKENNVLNTLDLRFNTLDITSVLLFEQILRAENHTIRKLLFSGNNETRAMRAYLSRNIEEHASALIKVPTVENLDEFLKLRDNELASLTTLKLPEVDFSQHLLKHFLAFCTSLLKCTHLRRLELAHLTLDSR